MRIKLSIPISTKFIGETVSPTAKDVPNEQIEYICTDTRDLRAHDLFFALPGENFDGEDFVEKALNKGAFVISKKYPTAHFPVNNTNVALLQLAAAYKKLLGIKYTIAITGSVGKTTTKNFTATILSQKYRTHSTYRNFNNQIGVPHTIFSTPADTEVLVVEAGMNHKGELSSLSECICPDVAIITNVGTAHIGNFGSKESLLDAKIEILAGLKKDGKVIIPLDERLIEKTKSYKTITASYISNNTDIYLQYRNNGKYYYNSSASSNLELECIAPGSHVGDCLVLALAASELLGLTQIHLTEGVKRIGSDDGQLRLVNKNGIIFLDDSHNASMESIIAGINSLKNTSAVSRCICIGDVLELGAYTEQIHLEIGKLCAQAGIRLLFIVGEYADFIYQGATEGGFPKDNIFINNNKSDLESTAKILSQNLKFGEAILIKASNKLRLGEILDYM